MGSERVLIELIIRHFTGGGELKHLFFDRLNACVYVTQSRRNYFTRKYSACSCIGLYRIYTISRAVIISSNYNLEKKLFF